MAYYKGLTIKIINKKLKSLIALYKAKGKGEKNRLFYIISIIVI
jgi:hypothetical protein